jgi:hypothetical protein
LHRVQAICYLRSSKKKRELFPGVPQTSPSSVMLPSTNPTSRFGENHFVSIANPAANRPTSVHTFHHRRTLFSKQIKHAGSRGHKAGCRILGQNQRMTQVYKDSEEPIFQELSPTVLTDADPLKVQDMTTQVQQTNSTKGTSKPTFP